VSEQESQDRGKKVFFLNPHSVVQEELILNILMNEYEAYMIKDHVRLRPLLAEFNDSILFVNIDAEVKGLSWAEYIKSIMSTEATMGVKIGVISTSENKELMKTYLVDLAVPCGYIRLRMGVEESTRLVLKALRESQAMGKRKFVRARCDSSSLASFNIKYLGRYHNGIIHDISSSGMAGSFESGLRLELGSRLGDMQLKLRTRLVRISGAVAGKRAEKNERELYVILFDRETAGDVKLKLHSFIHEVLQAEIEKKMTLGSAPRPEVRPETPTSRPAVEDEERSTDKSPREEA